jgi:hypothetical protein
MPTSLERKLLWRVGWRSNNLIQAILAGHDDSACAIARDVARTVLSLSPECIAGEVARMARANLKRGVRSVPPFQRRIERVAAAKCKGGRKPRAAVPSHCRLSIRLTLEERAAIESAAKVNNVCLAEVLREAVNEYVADYGERAVFKRISASRQRAAS